MAMAPEDVGTPIHRDLGVHVARGMEPWRILAQYLGRAGGPARGRDGSAHLSDAEDDELQAGALAVLGEALERAEASPLPDPETLLDGVYAGAASGPGAG